MAYNCKCQCESFRAHVGNGPMIDGKSMPTRSRAASLQKTEDTWEKDAAAYKRLDKEGFQLQTMDGAAEIEQKATQKVELEHGRIYGEKAKTMQMVADGGTY